MRLPVHWRELQQAVWRAVLLVPSRRLALALRTRTSMPKASDAAAQWSPRGYPIAGERAAKPFLIDRPLTSGIAKRPIDGVVGVTSTRTLHPTPTTKRSASGRPTAIAVRHGEPLSSVPQMLATFVRPPPDGRRVALFRKTIPVLLAWNQLPQRPLRTEPHRW
jgi:hypothetical protein